MFATHDEKRLATWSWASHAAGVVLTVTILTVTMLWVIRPMEIRVGELQRKAEQLSASLEVEAAIQAEHQLLTAKRLAADSKMDEMLDRIPAVPRESDFLGQITRLADEVGLSIVDYRPGVSEEKKGYKQMTLTLSSDGSYESICRFLSRIHLLPRLSRTLQLDVTPMGDESRYKMTMKLTIFFAPDSQLSVAGVERNNG